MTLNDDDHRTLVRAIGNQRRQRVAQQVLNTLAVRRSTPVAALIDSMPHVDRTRAMDIIVRMVRAQLLHIDDAGNVTTTTTGRKGTDR